METLFNVTDRRIEKKGNRNPFLGGLSKWVSYNSRMSMRKEEGVKGMFTLPPKQILESRSIPKFYLNA